MLPSLAKFSGSASNLKCEICLEVNLVINELRLIMQKSAIPFLDDKINNTKNYLIGPDLGPW